MPYSSRASASQSIGQAASNLRIALAHGFGYGRQYNILFEDSAELANAQAPFAGQRTQSRLPLTGRI